VIGRGDLDRKEEAALLKKGEKRVGLDVRSCLTHPLQTAQRDAAPGKSLPIIAGSGDRIVTVPVGGQGLGEAKNS